MDFLLNLNPKITIGGKRISIARVRKHDGSVPLPMRVGKNLSDMVKGKQKVGTD